MQKSLLALLGVSSGVFAAQQQNVNCAPEPAATCYPDDCKTCYCLGPENIIANAPARPVTCNGDWMITVAGVYWNANQDGMEYAIDNHVRTLLEIPSAVEDILPLNNLIDASYVTPNFDWDFGFKIGLGYNTTCDGWDIGATWTWYRSKARDHVEAEFSENHTLIALWSAYNDPLGHATFASDIETSWELQLNLIDIELGREFWVSKKMTFRPFIGLRIAFIDQEFDIQHKGGSWLVDDDGPLNNLVELDNDFQGVGVRTGLNSIFHLGCGWGIYGDLGVSIVYGRFDINEKETNREAYNLYDKIPIMETKDHFRASRAMLDLGLGIQWGGLFCECQYGITVSLGWEQHLFFDQNQFWRVNRIDTFTDIDNGLGVTQNDSGENSYYQRRGDLSTQGATLKVVFEF